LICSNSFYDYYLDIDGSSARDIDEQARYWLTANGLQTRFNGRNKGYIFYEVRAVNSGNYSQWVKTGYLQP